jgi:hypothetical protein
MGHPCGWGWDGKSGFLRFAAEWKYKCAAEWKYESAAEWEYKE